MKKPTARRGFTAAELMVAITAALLVSAGAYTLARTSLDVFQQEARMNAAQYSNVTAMNRLTTDIKRAGYMTSPDSTSDVQVCQAPAAPLDQMLIAVNVTEGDSSSPVAYGTGSGVGGFDYPDLPAEVSDATTNVRYPDRIRLSGNYTIAEKFKLGNVDNVGNKIALEFDQLAVQRIFKDQLAGGNGICTYFPNNSIARLIDVLGKARFTRITNCVAPPNVAGTNYASITLDSDAIPPVLGCGELTGGYINPISVIDYAPVKLNATTAAAMGLPAVIAGIMAEDDPPNAAAAMLGSGSRLTLVRRQLAADGVVLANTAEVVGDYIADLNFSARAANTPSTPNVLTAVPFGSVGGTPKNRIRSLGIRLTTRARAPDRSIAPVAPPPQNTPLQRFSVFPVGAARKYRWARVRTLFTEASISNLAGTVPW